MGGSRGTHGVERTGAHRGLVGRSEGRDRLEDLGVEGRIILKWAFKKWEGRAWTGLTWLRIGTVCGLL
jgi:hypothetical protein